MSDVGGCGTGSNGCDRRKNKTIFLGIVGEGLTLVRVETSASLIDASLVVEAHNWGQLSHIVSKGAFSLIVHRAKPRL